MTHHCSHSKQDLLDKVSNQGFKAWIKAQKSSSAQTLWNECPDGSWMLGFAGDSVQRQTLVLAACQCARLALKFVPDGETRPLLAIETAERWCRGEATLDEVRAAGYAAYAAADAANAAARAANAADAAYAAANAAGYATYTADAANAANAAYYAANAAAYAARGTAHSKTLADCANLVRKLIPYVPLPMEPNEIMKEIL